MEKRTIKEWKSKFLEGAFESPDSRTQIDAGWFDWFCKESTLAKKTKRMGQIIKQVKDDGKVDLNNWYVWFKNNCPVDGPLYDDFRFADLETREVQFTIQINCCWNNNKFTVFGRKNEFKEPLFETDSQKELIEWLNTPWEGEQGFWF